MTSPEFNKQFDLMQAQVNKLRQAESLAHDLGYSANYCDGMSCHEEYDFCVKEINDLVGTEWPASVKEAYQDGARQGYWDT